MEFVTVGTIINTRGLKGELKIKSTTDFAQNRYKKGNTVYFYHPEKKTQTPFVVLSYHSNQGFDYIEVQGVTTLEAAELYRGYEIQVPVQSLQPLPDDAYYHYQLIGCKVMNQEGILRGKVIGIDNHGPHDILRVQTKKRVALIPFVKTFLVNVNLEEKSIVIREIEGMFDADEN